MLALATVQWRQDRATFQASDQVWMKLLSRLRANPSAKGIDPAVKIEQAMANPLIGDQQRRITFTAREAEAVYAAAQK